jgi:hypothetical protein
MSGGKVRIDSGIICPFFNENKLRRIIPILQKLVLSTTRFPACFSYEDTQMDPTSPIFSGKATTLARTLTVLFAI